MNTVKLNEKILLPYQSLNILYSISLVNRNIRKRHFSGVALFKSDEDITEKTCHIGYRRFPGTGKNFFFIKLEFYSFIAFLHKVTERLPCLFFSSFLCLRLFCFSIFFV